MDSEILKYVLSSQGSVDREALECNLGDAAFIAEIIGSSDKLVACSFSGAARVVARSKVRLCRTKECPGCGGLHLCKNFLFSGACHLLQSRRGCSFSHDLHTEYNLEVLREFGVESLNRTELCLLLLQSNNTLLPQICHDYNNACGCWVVCPRLHVCERFLRGESCGCTRAHDFSAQQPLRLLREKHVPVKLFQLLKSVYVNKEALRLAEKGKGVDTRASSDANDECELSDVESAACDSDSSSTVSANQNQSRDGGQKKTRGGKGRKRNRQKKKTPSAAAPGCGQNVESFQDPNTAAETCEGYNSDSSSTLSTGQSKENRSGFCASSSVGEKICMFFIRGHCRHEDNCSKVHDMMPYRWQIKQDAFWSSMAENETIEKDFCDPQKTYSSTCPPVCFNTMRSGQYKVRRQSTVNSVVKPNYSHTTDWLWFWEHENGQWYQYTSKHRLISTTSKKIEENYVKNNKDVVMFKAGSQSHQLSFQDMTEKNLTNGTIRRVRRRPRFVSAAEVQNKRQSSTNIAAVPFYFDKTQIAQMSNTFLTFEQLQLTQLTQLTTTASTTKQLLQQNISPAAAANLATSSQATFATTSANISTKTSEKSLLGLPYLQTTTKPVNTVSSMKPQTASTQQATNVTTTNAATVSVNTFSTSRSQMTPTTTKSQSTFTTPQTTSANFEFTTPAAATKSTSPTSSTTGTSLANEFSNTTSTSGLKSSNQASQMTLNFSQTSTAFESPSLAAATKLTTGTTTSSKFTLPTTSATNTSSAFSPFAKSSNPFSATSSADRSQMTPTTSATAQFTSSTLKTSGLTSSNPFLTDVTTATPTSHFSSSTLSTSGLKSPTSQPMTSQATKSQITFTTTAIPTLPTSHFSSLAISTSGLKSPTSQPMTSQATKSQITFATTATPTSPTSHFSSSTLSTSGLKSPTSQPMTSQAMNSQITFATSAAASKSATSQLTFSTTAGTNSPHAFSTSSTKPQVTSTFAVKSPNPFSPTLSADRSQITPTTSSTAQFTPSTLKTCGLKPSNQFSTGRTPPKSEATTATSASKLQSTLSTTSGTNSPNAFSISSSTKPQSKAVSASSAAALATTSQLQPPIRSATATAASSAAKPQLRSQTSSTTRPEFELPTYSTTSSASAANSPKAFVTTAVDSTGSAVGTSSIEKPRATPTKNKESCIIL